MKKSYLFGAVCTWIIFFAPHTYSAGLSTYTLIQTSINDYPGTIDANTSVVSPSTASVTLNQTNGSSVYAGAASATAIYGTLRASAMADLTNYFMNSYFDCFDDGTEFPFCFGASAAHAQASYTDTLTIDNLQSDGLLHMTFTVDWTMDFTGALASGQAAISATSGNGIGQSDMVRFFDIGSGTSAVELVLSVPSGIPLNLSTRLFVDVTPNDWCDYSPELCGPIPTPYDALMLADFSNTATLTELLVTDLNNNPLAGINIQSESGTIYPVSPLNTVPIPAAVWLFGSGLIGLIGVARRKV